MLSTAAEIAIAELARQATMDPNAEAESTAVKSNWTKKVSVFLKV